jgi:hypothetical protein
VNLSIREAVPDHRDFDPVLKPTSSAAVVGEDRGAVAVGIRVDEVQRLIVGVDAQHGEHRSENLISVDAHLGAHSVDQRWAEPESARHVGAVGCRLRPSKTISAPAASPASISDATFSRSALVISGPYVSVTRTLASLDAACPLGDLSHQGISDIGSTTPPPAFSTPP